MEIKYLKIIFDDKKFDIKFIDQNIFLKIIKKELKSEEIEILNIMNKNDYI